MNKAVEEKLSIRDLRREIHKEKYNNTLTEAILPTGKYRVIYADPPWTYGNDRTYFGGDQISHYPSMTIEELCIMPIKEIIEDNSVLFIWDKIKHTMGHYSSVRHELLLLCIKGSYPIQNKKLYDSVYSEERTKHSKKPDFYYGMIEDLYPNSNKIELFSRYKREGWRVYGNQL